MNAKALIELNNEKRKQLTKENLEYYEEMLVYIRLSYDKSEQETEEILSELLNHLLEAQEVGKSAEDIFGDKPKQYADEIIGELPKMVTKERMQFFIMGALYFLAASTIFSGIFTLISHYVFEIEELTKEVFTGSLAFKIVVMLPVAFLLLYIVIQYLRWSCFKKINKIAEFFIFWAYGIISIGIFMGVIYITPDFGPVIEISIFVVFLLGIVLYFAARMTRNAI